MIKAGIIGGAGYTGGELIRILLNHPHCEIKFVQSRSQKGKKITEIHTDLLGETNLKFYDKIDESIDIMFLCLGHGESKIFMKETNIAKNIKVIDLSQDFRLGNMADRKFVYGLPEANYENIKSAQNIANPGCFATAIQLALLPMAANNHLQNDIHVSGITGSTGAGQKPSITTHFSWRSSNISLYKAFEHQHLAEINKTIEQLQRGKMDQQIYFLPFRGNFTRGILASVYTKTNLTNEEAFEMYSQFYEKHPFVFITDVNPDIKQVLNTNKAILFLQKHDDVLNIVSVIDNLVKGASGQAVQNMNLMFGLDETSGLRLKPVAF
ncbi:MAG: N-acetyl-gamma-glutamyl-phosphate reductase [Calditrichaeota bacterium]|nr:MAG: N-acetyl-gamma-glutamyl-phosphate reductase [Calditrichota bacterium]MBL1205724.1 N-acetyl-gamma-glutamyl-phosphate reductase [Calditrichota bacterium]NOG45552.1 N-acetyl-gamma-glutamyl-phosphate reductase [Calditrichota bacterium]